MSYRTEWGFIKVKVPYLTRRSSGLFYYRRGIPEDLRAFYNGKRELVLSLQTRDEKTAIRKVQQLAKQHSSDFEQLRKTGERNKAVAFLKQFGLEDAPLDRQPAYKESKDYNEIPSPYWQLQDRLNAEYLDSPIEEFDGDFYARGGFKAKPHQQRALDILKGEEKITLEEVKALALKHVEDKKKIDELNRVFRYFEDNLTVKVISDIRTRDVQLVVNKLILEEGLKSATVKKALGRVRKAIRETILLYDLDIKNPFENITLERIGKDSEKRHAFSYQELKLIRSVVRSKSHLLTAQIVGLLLDTGCRNGEIGGLLLDDIRLDDSIDNIPNIRVKPTDNRTLKNSNSERIIPLTGLSLEMAKIVKANATDGQIYAFPRYNEGGKFKNEGCSQAVNKFLSGFVNKGTSHSFRHSLNDRLKESGADAFEITSLLGWTGQGMVYHYGITKATERLSEVLNQMHEFEKRKGLI